MNSEFQKLILNDLLDCNITNAKNIAKDVFNLMNEKRLKYHNFQHPLYIRNFTLIHNININNYVKLGIWFHDVFFLPKLNINEEISTQIMENILLNNQVDPEFINNVKKIILITKKFLEPNVIASNDELLMMDLDLCSLADPNINVLIDNFNKLISEGSNTLQNSINFYNLLLNRKNIFRTKLFQAKFEKIAVSNCNKMLDYLK